MIVQKIEDLRKAETFDHVRFEDSESDDLVRKDLKIERCEFVNVGLKDASIQASRIQHSRFVRAYLRNAQFDRTDFTGCTFEDCNLRYAVFSKCVLDYVSFSKCDVNYDSIIDNLPSLKNHPNLRMHLLRSLRLNAQSTGDTPQADRLFLREMESARQDLQNALLNATTYYTNKYSMGDRIRSLFELLGHYFQNGVWGYGLRLRRLLVSAVAFVVISAALTFLFQVQFQTAPPSAPATVWSALYFSLASFVGCASEMIPADNGARFALLVNRLAGTIFLGCFAAAVYRRIRR